MEDGKPVKIMLPASIASLSSYESNVKFQSLSNYEIQKVLYGKEKLTYEGLALAFENQLSKYKKVQVSCDTFSAKITNEANKMLSNLKIVPNESRLCESDAWHSARVRNAEFKMKQRGNYCLYVEIDIPMNLKVLAQKLVRDGKVLTVDYEGEVSQELHYKYYVHSHNSASKCVEGDCIKVELEEYVRTENLDDTLDIKTLTAYLEYADRFTSAFIRNIIVTPSSQISSSHYHFQFHHSSTNNEVKLVGVLWPDSMQSINLIGYESLSEEQTSAVYNKYLNVANDSVTTSSDAMFLKSKFSLSNNDAENVVKLVKQHQVKICLCNQCTQCRNTQLPSLVLMFSNPATTPENIYPCTDVIETT